MANIRENMSKKRAPARFLLLDLAQTWYVPDTDLTRKWHEVDKPPLTKRAKSDMLEHSNCRFLPNSRPLKPFRRYVSPPLTWPVGRLQGHQCVIYAL